MKTEDILSKANEIKPWILEKRRKIHRHPELMYEEFETSKLVQETLTNLGIPFQKDIAITGVVGMIGDGNGPCIALRACLLYTSPSPRDKRQSRMPSSA